MFVAYTKLWTIFLKRHISPRWGYKRGVDLPYSYKHSAPLGLPKSIHNKFQKSKNSVCNSRVT